MAKYSQEQIESFVCQKYAECIEIVEEMGTLVQSVQPDFSTDIALRQFDVILQATLLNAAVIDGSFEDCELHFIGGIAKYSDLMPLVNAELTKQDSSWPGLTWNQINQLDPETKKHFAAVAAAVVDKYAEEFVSFFAIVDKVITEKDYMNLLYELVALIIVGFVGYDGDDNESEKANNEGSFALAIFEELVIKKWKAAIEEQ